MKILSVSRRTDIAAFYTEWFVERIRAGYVRWPNPYGGKPGEMALGPGDVSVAVFWSKNYAPLVPHLPLLDSLGWGLCFHYTITGLPRVFEPNVPDADHSIRVMKELSERYGPEAVSWRYDPILISSITDAEYHVARFRELASALEGITQRCYFSFPQFYAKTRRNVDLLERDSGVRCVDPCYEQKIELALRLAQIAQEYGISMYSCCGGHLVGALIHKAHCIDPELLSRLFPDRMRSAKSNPTRKECGCCESKDIGVYDTCPHGCVYCYANTSKSAALARHLKCGMRDL